MARPIAKKYAIISSALKLFAQKGVKGTTTRDIASSSHSAEGLIYRYFKSKEELALKIFAQCLIEFADFLKAEAGKGESPEEKLGKTIEAFFRFAKEKPLAYEYVILGHEREFKKLPEPIFLPKDVFVDIIQEGIRKGVFKKRDENLAAAMVIGMAMRVHFFIKNRISKVSEEEGVQEVIRSAWKILKR